MKKLVATLVMTVMTFALLPALAASAAANGSANLLGATTVFPTATDADEASDSRAFQIEVENDDAMLSLSGAGATISTIRVFFPANVIDPVCADQDGFKCVTFGQPGANGLALQGGAILPGGSAVIDFDAVVNAPINNDRTDSFRVQVSDGGADGFTTATGNLALTVRALQVDNGINLSNAALDQSGATITETDNRVTSGQTVTATFDVTNHAERLQGVTPELGVSQATLSSFTDPAGNGGTQPATFSIDTSGVTAGTTTLNLVAKAESPNAESETLTQNLLIDAPVALDVLGRTGSVPGLIANGAPVAISVDADKFNPPALPTLSTTVSLSVAGIADAPIVLNTTNAIGNGDSPYLLSFDETAILFPSLAAAAPGLYPVDATFTQTAIDSNGASVSYTETVANLLTIDTAGPFITVDATAGYAIPADDRFKEGDTLTITGRVQESVLDESAPADLDVSSLAIKVGTLDVPSNRISYDNGSFSATFTVPAGQGANGGPTFGEQGLVNVVASAADVAGNGTSATTRLTVDNIIPVLAPSAVVDDVTETYTYLVDGSAYGESGTVIRASFSPGGAADLALDPVAGGCNPLQWSVDGATVTDVLFWNGSSCQNSNGAAPELTADAPAGSNRNDRILVMDFDSISVADLPLNVTYDDGSSNGLFGGATAQATTDLVRNVAVRQTAELINGLIPLDVQVGLFERIDITDGDATPNGDYEPVGQSTINDVTSYHFNTTDIRVSLPSGTSGDFLQIIDTTTGALLGEIQLATTGDNVITTEILTQAGINPFPADNSTRFIDLRYRRPVASQGDLLSLNLVTIALVNDTVAPRLAPLDSRTVVTDAGNNNSEATVYFTEEIASGDEDAIHWTALRTNVNAASNDNPYLAYFVNSVSADPTDRTARTLNMDLNGHTNIDAIEFEFLDFGTARYEDLAGNLITNTLTTR